MQAIWRKTFELLRRYPALWWPALLADLLTVGLQYLRKIIGFQIVQWSTASVHSVLGGPSIPVEPSMLRVMILGGTVNIGIYYLCVLLFSIAMVFVAMQV